MRISAAEFDHKCSMAECPTFGQRTERSCGCHVSREQMMLNEIARLRKRLLSFDICDDSGAMAHVVEREDA